MTAIASIGGRGSFPPALIAVAAIPALLVALPVAYAVMRSSEAGLSGIVSELARPVTLELLGNTLTLAISVTVLTVIIGVAGAWCTERCDIPWPGLWRVVASAPLAVPAFVSSYAWASLGPAYQGMAGAVMILTLSCTPLIYLPVAAALRGIQSPQTPGVGGQQYVRPIAAARWTDSAMSPSALLHCVPPEREEVRSA